MLEQELNELKQFLSKGKKAELPLLGVDYGDKRIGVAVTDIKGLVTSPIETVKITKIRSFDGAIEDILKIAEEYRVKGIILGFPHAFEEAHEKAQKKIKWFAEKLEEKTNLPIFLFDESYSTVDAQDVLLSLGQNRKSSKDKIDKVSAAYFLQNYLNSTKNEREIS